MRDVRTEGIELNDDSTALESSVLMSLIKNRQIHGKRRYRPFKLLRYSVPVEYKDIEAAVRSPGTFSAKPFLQEVEGYPTLQFEDCILGLEGHNALYVFMVDETSLHDAKRRRKASRRGTRPRRASTSSAPRGPTSRGSGSGRAGHADRRSASAL